MSQDILGRAMLMQKQIKIILTFALLLSNSPPTAMLFASTVTPSVLNGSQPDGLIDSLHENAETAWCQHETKDSLSLDLLICESNEENLEETLDQDEEIDFSFDFSHSDRDSHSFLFQNDFPFNGFLSFLAKPFVERHVDLIC